MLYFATIILLFSMVGASWITKRECNEVLTGPVGVLQFTDPYKELKSYTLYCNYNISVETSSNISVSIPSISMSSTVNDCRDSYIALKDGHDESSPSLGAGKYCGNESVDSLTTTGNKLSVHTAIELGFDAHYMLKYQDSSLECGGISEITPGMDMKVEVRNTPSYCTWVFIAPPNHVLSIIFTMFNRYSSVYYDNGELQIRDGGTNVSPLISTTGTDSETTATTTDNLLYMNLASNYRQTDSLIAFITAVENSCGGTLRADNGVIISPNYPFNSPNKICTWNIIAPSKKRIVFQFHDLDLSDSSNCEQKNYLKIAEKLPETGTNKILGTFCGSTKPSNIKTAGNKASIQFRSDYHSIGDFRGFILNFTTTDEPYTVNCSRILTSDNGIISSPNFPDNYQSNQNCEWKINLSPEKKIKFQFFRIMIDNSPSCSEDYLLIQETINGEDKTLGLYCNDSNPMTIVTSSSVANVIFHSDEKNEDSGFLLTYSAIEESLCDNFPDQSTATTLSEDETPNERCGGLLTDRRGNIRSPNFPSEYEAGERCVWTIKPPLGHHRIKLYWKFFETESDFDYVLIKERSENGVERIIGKYSGYALPPTILSQENILQIVFDSDSSNNMRGFLIEYVME